LVITFLKENKGYSYNSGLTVENDSSELRKNQRLLKADESYTSLHKWEEYFN
jgi:hypothetical protein